MLSLGAGFEASQHHGTRPNDLGRTSIVAHSFVTTFSSPCMLSTASTSIDGCIASVPAPPAPVLDQPFVVGPGFSPIPAKLVAQISTGKYINISDLMAANLPQVDPKPQLLFDGLVVFTSYSKRNCRQIEDIIGSFSNDERNGKENVT